MTAPAYRVKEREGDKALNFTAIDASPVPLYFQVANAIRAAVESRSLPPGAAVGSEQQLAKDFRVSIPTIRKAIGLLESEGIVVRKRGVGTYVSASVRKKPLAVCFLGDPVLLTSLPVELGTIVADHEVRRELALAQPREVWRLRRILKVGDRPVAMFDDLFPAKPSDQEVQSVSGDAIGPSGLGAGSKANLVRCRISAELAKASPLRPDEVFPGAPLQVLIGTVYGWDGAPIRCLRHAFLAEHFRFEVTL
ncbi:GntR family transcriptional regulator [Pseudarthrobacter oxydans]|uniref:GntR family transcriptional regulator n=1 Tax=Pseudarthrobacter oxydans TaxID=1671 RepID=UPI0037F61A9B